MRKSKRIFYKKDRLSCTYVYVCKVILGVCMYEYMHICMCMHTFVSEFYILHGHTHAHIHAYTHMYM